MIDTRLLLPLSAAAVLALTACGSGTPAEDRTTDISTSDEAEVEEVTDDGDEGPVQAELGTSYEFDDGLTIEMTDIERATTGEWAMPENADYLRFTVQIQNGTGSPVDLTLFHIQCQYGEGGHTGESVYDTEGGVGDGFTSTVMDGNNATATFGCELPADESQIQIEVNVGDETETDWMRPTAFFTGEF